LQLGLLAILDMDGNWDTCNFVKNCNNLAI
jgi:hypothetical protein